jgi:SAM-dependent methyltransferase
MDVCGYCEKQNSISLYPTSDIFGNSYAIHRCNECNAYFLAPRPDARGLSQAYDLSYYGEQDEKFKSSKVEDVLDMFRKKRAKKLSRYLNENDKVLDIGCGNGRFLAYLNEYGNYKIYGTELEGKAATRAARVPNLILKTGMPMQGDFEDGVFKAVTMFHVFEHLEKPLEMLDIINRVLCSKGLLVISFPNIASLQSRLFKGKWLHLDPPRHLFFITPHDFVQIMNKRGYTLMKEKYFSAEQNPYGAIQSTLNLFCKKREVLFESLKGNKEYVKEYSKTNMLMQKGFFVFSFPFFILSDIFESLFKRGATVEFTFVKK